MLDLFICLLNKISFYNTVYWYTDFIFFSVLLFLISFIIFCFNAHKPFLLLIALEIMYLTVNFNFILSWLYNDFEFGLAYVLLIIGFSVAESVVGLAILVKLFSTFSVQNSMLIGLVNNDVS